MKNDTENLAVSPIIGTILLVAITVVFAAIITAVLLGLSGDPDTKDVGINAQPAVGANATIILYGGASLYDLVELAMIDQGSLNGTYIEFWNSSVTDQVTVGYPYPVKEVARPLGNMSVYETMINVKGTFSDGREVILLVQPMTFKDVIDPNYVEEVKVPVVVSVMGWGTVTIYSDDSLTDIYKSGPLQDFALLTGFMEALTTTSGSKVYYSELIPLAEWGMMESSLLGAKGDNFGVPPEQYSVEVVSVTLERVSIFSSPSYVENTISPSYGVINTDGYLMMPTTGLSEYYNDVYVSFEYSTVAVLKSP